MAAAADVVVASGAGGSFFSPAPVVSWSYSVSRPSSRAARSTAPPSGTGARASRSSSSSARSILSRVRARACLASWYSRWSASIASRSSSVAPSASRPSPRSTSNIS